MFLQGPQVRSYYDAEPATLRGFLDLDIGQELDVDAGGLLSPTRLEAKVPQMCEGKQRRSWGGGKRIIQNFLEARQAAVVSFVQRW